MESFQGRMELDIFKRRLRLNQSFANTIGRFGPL